MKTTWMIALVILFGSLGQAAPQRVVVFEYQVGNAAIQITTDAPVKNGGGISFNNAMAEVKGQTFRIETRSLYQLWAEHSICANLEFKNLYVRSTTAEGQKAMNMVSADVTASDNKPLAENIVCMERPY